jgi:hypothetical protein
MSGTHGTYLVAELLQRCQDLNRLLRGARLRDLAQLLVALRGEAEREGARVRM